METVIFGAFLRLFQVIVYAAPWIVFGFFIAGILDKMLGREKTRQLFGGDGLVGIFQGWAWGMLLPVCSLGVIPVIFQLRRSGVKGGSLIAFALTAPLFNPLSVLYGLTLSDPVTILAFAFCSLLIVGVVGVLWDRIFPTEPEGKTPPAEQVEVGVKRVVAVAKSSSQMIFSPVSLFIIVGIAGSVGLSILLPHGALSSMLERDNMAAPAAVAGLGTAVYSTPLLAMSQIGSMFQHGNSIGAAFSLLIFGAGVNLGVLGCFWRFYGIKKVSVFFGLLLAIGLGLAYLVSEPLFPKGVEVAGHTHAFDVYTNPFHSAPPNITKTTLNEMQKHWVNHEFGGTLLVSLLALMGLVFFAVEKYFPLKQWLEQKSEKKSMDVELPNSVLATVSVIGLISLSVFGCYVYYPSSDDVLGDMTALNADAVLAARSGNWDGAKKWISYQEDLSRRLEVGTFIRTGSLRKFHRTKASIYRDSLEDLKHAIEDSDQDKAAELALESDKLFRRMKKAFQN